MPHAKGANVNAKTLRLIEDKLDVLPLEALAIGRCLMELVAELDRRQGQEWLPLKADIS